MSYEQTLDAKYPMFLSESLHSFFVQVFHKLCTYQSRHVSAYIQYAREQKHTSVTFQEINLDWVLQTKTYY